MEALELARLIAQEALDTKAQDLRILDLQNLVSYTDYFVLATASSNRQAQAMADRVYLRIKKELKKLPISLEGQGPGQWVLIDYGDVVFHIFLPEHRQYYGLDEMWADAPEIEIPGVKPKARAARGQGARKKTKTKAPAKKKPAKKAKAKKRSR